MEGLYLRNLIFLNLFSESHGTGIYCIVGWGNSFIFYSILKKLNSFFTVTPIFFVGVWLILKMLLDDNYCWNKIEEIPVNYLIDVPIIITVLVSMSILS